MLAAPPDILRWSPRSDGHGDCAVAAIELACGITYEQALSVCLGAAAGVLNEGLTGNEIKKAIKFLGLKPTLRFKFDIEEDTGILSVGVPDHPGWGHVVYLWEGRIVEPENERRQLWLSAASFLQHYGYTAEYLITIAGDK